VKTSSLVENKCIRMLLWFGIALTGIGAGVGAWIAASPKEPETDRSAARQQPKGKHFDGTVHFDLLAKLLTDDRRAAQADWLRELDDPKAGVETQSNPLLGQQAPDITLRDHRGQCWTLQESLGKGPVVVVFYLGYSCPACVHGLVELNADLQRFHGLGTQIVAISGDTPDITWQRFQQYGNFGFAVLSDPGHSAAQAYGTFSPANAAEPEDLRHATFLIGRDGKICWATRGDAPFRNNKALLYEVARLEKKLPRSEPTLGTSGKEPQTP
jgi:peroxiredoxin